MIMTKKCQCCLDRIERPWTKWGETEEFCPFCKKETKVYYKPEGMFIINHCSECHKSYDEDYPTLAKAIREK